MPVLGTLASSVMGELVPNLTTVSLPTLVEAEIIRLPSVNFHKLNLLPMVLSALDLPTAILVFLPKIVPGRKETLVSSNVKLERTV